MTSLRLDPSLLRIDPDTFVAHNATLIGDVHLAAGANVWFNAVIRGDEESIRVGRDSNVQDGAILHADPGFPCIVGEQVTIGHRALVHGATLEDGCVVGMGATVLNGAVVGAGAVIGAGALVSENTVIPPGAVVMGMPAKVRRVLGEAEQEAMRKVASYYADNGRTYAAAGYGQARRPSVSVAA